MCRKMYTNVFASLQMRTGFSPHPKKKADVQIGGTNYARKTVSARQVYNIK